MSGLNSCAWITRSTDVATMLTNFPAETRDQHKWRQSSLTFFQKYSCTLLNDALSPPANTKPRSTCCRRRFRRPSIMFVNYKNERRNRIFIFQGGLEMNENMTDGCSHFIVHVRYAFSALAFWCCNPNWSGEGMLPQSSTLGGGPSDAGVLMQDLSIHLDSTDWKI